MYSYILFIINEVEKETTVMPEHHATTVCTILKQEKHILRASHGDLKSISIILI